jgi:fructose-1,6-bisphosphatase-3
MNTTPDAQSPLTPPSDADLAILRAMSDRFHNVDAALAEVARVSAVMTLPKGTVHVISDVHGEDKKLRHVINNASGTLRTLVEKRFADRLTPDELREFTTLVFYPAEVTERWAARNPPADELRAFVIPSLLRQFELVRVLASRFSFRRAMAVFPPEYKDLFLEMFHAPTPERGEQFVRAAADEMLKRGRALNLVHITGRLIRNLAIYELVIGGDCWDRGPRGDRVVDYLRQQPNVSFVWGNHDAAWLGAALGHGALICHVLRVSLRYRRLTQLDEGYSIPLTMLEHLARTAYADDPATQFMPKAKGLRPDEVVARMQKAAAVMQFKLEGQMIARHPEWEMDHRRLLHRIDLKAGTVEIDGVRYPLRDRLFPTINPKDPYALTDEEQACLDRHCRSFMASQKLWSHMRYLTGIGRCTSGGTST